MYGYFILFYRKTEDWGSCSSTGYPETTLINVNIWKSSECPSSADQLKTARIKTTHEFFNGTKSIKHKPWKNFSFWNYHPQYSPDLTSCDFHNTERKVITVEVICLLQLLDSLQHHFYFIWHEYYAL